MGHRQELAQQRDHRHLLGRQEHQQVSGGWAGRRGLMDSMLGSGDRGRGLKSRSSDSKRGSLLRLQENQLNMNKKASFFQGCLCKSQHSKCSAPSVNKSSAGAKPTSSKLYTIHFEQLLEVENAFF